MTYVYPALRYQIGSDAFCVVHNESEDKALGNGWDDPAGVRVAADLPCVETVTGPVDESAPVVERKKPGRKPRVQA